ncbi:hypothetical protein ACF0H5_006478 [Mactra antiquata]
MELKGLILRVGFLSIVCVGAFDQLTTSDLPQDVVECIDRTINTRDGRLTNITTDEAHLQCLQIFFWKFGGNEWSATNVTEDDTAYINSLIRSFISRSRQKRQSPGPETGIRIRREYRMLSDAARNAYHAAVNALKSSGQYNRYANIHRAATRSAHGGPNFLGWHRVYLALYEEALRRINSNVALPYWDSSLDFHMNRPDDSIIWSAAFLGNGDGFVRTGPFAGWRTSTDRRLTRNVGRRSRLISKPVINDILTRCRMSQISVPTAARRYDLETHHGGPHNWVGGQMMSLLTSADDPVFFMHHAFVDYIWELFRLHQVVNCSVDPSTDYPRTTGLHAPNRRMVRLPPYRNVDGIRLYWTELWYRYEYSPTCSSERPTCRSPYLRCDRRNWRCISETRLRRFVETPLSVGFAAIAANVGMSFAAANGLRSQTEESREIETTQMFQAPPPDPRNRPLFTVNSRKRRQAVQLNNVNNVADVGSVVSALLQAVLNSPQNNVSNNGNVSIASNVPGDEIFEPRHEYEGFGGNKVFNGGEPMPLLPVPYYNNGT